MGTVTLEQMSRLYWLGRYSERVYTTLRIFAERYDSMIDIDEDEFKAFCRAQEIPNIYTDKHDFVSRYCFDENDPNSIFSNLDRAYDNAIVLREEIGSGTLSYIQLAIYDMNRAKVSEAPMIELQKVEDNILAFWGIADDSIDDESVRDAIKIGKRVERIDIYARLKLRREELVREVARLNGRLQKKLTPYNHTKLMHINYLVEAEPTDYDEIVKEIESLMEV